MLQFVNNFCQSLSEKKLVTAQKSVLISVSGGQDSMCLVFLLYVIQTHRQLSFDSIWCNHFWQKSSFFTMAHIVRYSHSLSLRSVCCLPLNDMFSEQSARNWRHSVIQRAYQFYHYNLCAYGHNKSDRVETILLNLIRGAGMVGISALPRKKRKAYFIKNNLYPSLFQLAQETHLKSVAPTCISLKKKTYFETFSRFSRKPSPLFLSQLFS